MASKYQHQKIEKKWQDKWEEQKLYTADDTSTKPKEYILDMFPYPSGAGLHAGHVEGYAATDIAARFARMNGKEVLHPMGWDAFGLPAENYAIKTKTPPRESTDKAIDNFRRQIKSLGLSYDWSREIGTHTPEYYRWTQWFFLLLYKQKLAYRAKAKVNWCPKDQTVLANEQVVEGVCERCGTLVEQKDLHQWFFQITRFAEELLDGLTTIDWPESTKSAQKNWIGKSEGAEIDFAIAGSDISVKVFTTRPDTLFGATYLVLAPEHPLVEKILETLENAEEVRVYVDAAKHKTDLERAVDSKEKTGVELKGVNVINPANNDEIPVYVADYVLGSYGTGAIMAVPAHDERDFEFAQKFGLRSINVIDPYPIGPCVSVIQKIGGESDITKELKVQSELILKGERVWTGAGNLRNSGKFIGMEKETAKNAITKSVGGKTVTRYRLRDWLVSRQRYWGVPIPIIYCEQCGTVPVPEEDLPVMLPEDVDFMPTGESPLAHSKSFHDVTCPTCGKPARRESDTMDTFVCSSWYYFRFADPHNENAFASPEKIKKWLPVDLYVGGAEHSVLHLLYARFITKVLHSSGLISFNEPFKKLRHQGMILAQDGRKMSKSLGNVVNPDDVVSEYGADTLRLYEMFMGPLDVQKPWNTKNISGSHRFVERAYRLLGQRTDKEPQEFAKVLEETIKKVGEDIKLLKFNTAISQLMICLNAAQDGISQKSLEVFTLLLAPFAPHLAEEMWCELGHNESVHKATWPTYDDNAISQGAVTVAVQINGKRRGEVVISSDTDETTALESARAIPSIATILSQGEPKRVIYVPGRIINIVV